MEKALIDLTEKELKEVVRQQNGNLHSNYQSAYDELRRRDENKNAKEMNRWTAWITVATIINTIAALLTTWASFHK